MKESEINGNQLANSNEIVDNLKKNDKKKRGKKIGSIFYKD